MPGIIVWSKSQGGPISIHTETYKPLCLNCCCDFVLIISVKLLFNSRIKKSHPLPPEWLAWWAEKARSSMAIILGFSPLCLPGSSQPPLSDRAKLAHQFIPFIHKQCVPIFQLPDCGIQLRYPLLVSAQVLLVGSNIIQLLILYKIHASENNPQKPLTSQFNLSSPTNCTYGFLQYSTCWQKYVHFWKKVSGLGDTLIENLQLFRKNKNNQTDMSTFFHDEEKAESWKILIFTAFSYTFLLFAEPLHQVKK